MVLLLDMLGGTSEKNVSMFILFFDNWYIYLVIIIVTIVLLVVVFAKNKTSNNKDENKYKIKK